MQRPRLDAGEGGGGARDVFAVMAASGENVPIDHEMCTCGAASDTASDGSSSSSSSSSSSCEDALCGSGVQFAMG